ncbi:hypothetical protein J0X15_01970 [Roseibium sp. CAU 1637]|uniref:Cadherin domain-containing protein n=1 Tax=Roseibium limicola TaxID=2816037 RepID=A0A939J5E1_9HYPH|nr:hypothetical protein [Roseibium limicola]MBO0343972.1 hypothetical protein [Roseibium limicola]
MAYAFDEVFYLNQNPDVAEAVQKGLIASGEAHYDAYGWKEGRDPAPLFDTSFYLQENPDVAAAGINPFTHYNTYGAVEGRNPSLYFDAQFYLSANGDVAAAGVNPLQHWIEYGVTEGRDPSAYFDASFYLQANPDVAQAGLNPLAHFLQYGASETRAPNATIAAEVAAGFDEQSYLGLNGDVAAAVADGAYTSGYHHWLLFGFNESRGGAQSTTGTPLSSPYAPSSPSTPAPSGSVTDGKVAGATVGIDVNGDGVISADEPTVTTDDAGNFVFPDGTPQGAIIATGGTDIATGLAFEGRMEAPAGSTVVNPLTTVIKKMADADTDSTKSATQKLADAQTKLKALLGLDNIDADITKIDFVAESTEGDVDNTKDQVSDKDAAALYAASSKLLNIVAQGSAAITGTDGTVSGQNASDAVFKALAEKLGASNSSSPIDLGATSGADDDFLTTVIKTAATSSLSPENAAKAGQIADSAATIAAAANKGISNTFDSIPDGATGTDIQNALVNIVQTQKVVQGTASDQIKQAAGSADPDAAAKAASDGLTSDGDGTINDDVVADQTVGDVNGDGTPDEAPEGDQNPTTPTPTPDTTAPTITSATAFDVAENSTTVATITANEGANFAISGGADADLFTINTGTGALEFIAAPDFETPRDVGADNTYEVEVTATDGSGNISTASEIAVSVNNVVEDGQTLQEAIDAAQDGDTIVLQSGTYTGQFKIDSKSNLHITAAAGADVKIQASADLTETAVSSSGRSINAVVTVLNSENITFSGIEVDGAGAGDTVDNVTGNRANFIGVYYQESSGGLENVDVTGVRDAYTGGKTLGGKDVVKGNQRGVGVQVDNTSLLDFSMEGGSISDFQKNATVFSFTNLAVSGVTIVGGGAQTIIAQNGFQVTNSTGSISGNDVTEVGYAGTGNWASSSILAYENSDLSISDNTIVGTNSEDLTTKSYGVIVYSYGGQNSGGEISGNFIDGFDNPIYVGGDFDSRPLTLGDNQIINVDEVNDGDGLVWAPNFLTSPSEPINISGTEFSDYFFGSDNSDTFTGLAGDDEFEGGAGDDILIGGEGIDTAYYDGSIQDYKFTELPDGSFTIEDTRIDSPNGTDTLTGIETLVFGRGNDDPKDDHIFSLPEDFLLVDLQDGIGVGEVTWVQDRTEPLSYTTDIDPEDATNQVINFTVNGAGTQESFYRYQGVKIKSDDGDHWVNAAESSKLSVDFYIDPTWAGDSAVQQTGVWLTLKGEYDDGAGGNTTFSHWPIAEYLDPDAVTKLLNENSTIATEFDINADSGLFRFWNSEFGWEEYVQVDLEGWNNLTFSLEEGKETWFINGDELYTYEGDYTEADEVIETVIFNSLNHGTNESYLFDNLQISGVSTDDYFYDGAVA